MTIAVVPRPTALPEPADRLVVVEASAGTGKTYFLEHRVADLVLAGAELHQILLVTFTDKAVAELRLRIRDLLDRLARTTESSAQATPDGTMDRRGAWHIDDAARARLRAAVIGFDHAPIFTIHGFCHRVLVEEAFAAARLFEQTQIADEVAFDAAFMDLVRSRFATTAPDVDLLGAYLARGSTLDHLRALLLTCARKGALPRIELDSSVAYAIGNALRAAFGTGDLRAALVTSLALTGNDKRYAPAWIEHIGRAVEQWDGTAAGALAVCDSIRKHGRSEPGPNLLPRLAKASARAHASAPAVAKNAHAMGLAARARADDPSQRPQTCDIAAIEAALRAALAQPSLDAAVVATMLPPLLERIGTVKAERGMFDYDDMLRLVRDALQAPGGDQLARRLRSRTPWVMIDEFQDTDRVQWDIFRAIWLSPETKGLTIVGDPKQAIYGFRGADVATYCAARDQLVQSGATVVQLDVNYRATAEMVRAVNRVLAGDGISPLLDDPGTSRPGGHEIRYDHPVKPSNDVTCASARPPITVFAMRGSGKLDGKREANRRALAAAIATEIEQLRRTPIAWSSRGQSSDFSLSQVMVLTRTNKDSNEIAGALRSRGLACAVVESDRLFETREAAELASVLAAVAAPRDRSARMRALRSRFFDVAWDDLMQVVDAPDHHPLIARLLDWAALANRRAYEPLLRSLIEDSRFAERALITGGGERAIMNTWHLIEIVLGEVARSRCDLYELVTKLRRWIADGDDRPDDRDVQRAESDADAIRILTVHKAKGLEAPYVFLFGAASPPKSTNVHTVRDAHGLSLVVGPQAEPIAKLVQEEATAENQRLAYVALTRAKVRLYLPCYTDGVVDAKSMYHSIERCLLPLVSRGCADVEVVEIDVERVKTAEIPLDALAGLEPPAAPQVHDLTEISGTKAGMTTVSYSRLRHVLHGPAELAAPTDAPVPQPLVRLAAHELPPGADAGLLLHDLFERVDLDPLRTADDVASWLKHPQTAALIADCARDRGIAARFHRHAAELVFATLTQPLNITDGHALPPLTHARLLTREVEFVYPTELAAVPGVRDHTGLVKGYIDALVAWDDDLWIIDYKSDLLIGDPLRVAADHVQHHYAVQQRLYALAVDRMRGGRTLAGMLFPFVRYGVAVAVRFDPDQLAAWAAWLSELANAA